MILWLVGMMGAGKTSAGQLAASRIGVPFSDTDSYAAQQMGCSVAQMWNSLGESAFRDVEKAAVKRLAAGEGIVSTGGGVILDEENRDIMTAAGAVVWLDTSPVVLEARLANTSDRPGLIESNKTTLEFVEHTLEIRHSLYEAVATHRIHTDALSIEETADAIEAIWNA